MSDEKLIERTFLTYDDVLIMPGKSLGSRNKASYGQAVHGAYVKHPIIPANMDSVSGEALCSAALKEGGIAVLHRFMSIKDRIEIWQRLDRHYNLFVSVGVSREELQGIQELSAAGIKNFCIDIAHGHSDKMATAIQKIRLCEIPSNPTIIMAGNIATIDGFEFLYKLGADIIKVGVGPGSHCTTRIVTGCGVPQFSAVMEIAAHREFLQRYDANKYVYIVADGGLKNSGDITKALGAGADLVMSGSFFAGCKEAPGNEMLWKDGTRWKIYRGMASKDAQVGWKNGIDKDKIVAEGEASLVPYKGEYSKILFQLLGGLSSGMSYIGAHSIIEMHKKTRFVKVSPNTLIENRPHGKQ